MPKITGTHHTEHAIAVVVVASAFGPQAVRRAGHKAWIETVGLAGASGYEVRRELFAHEAEGSFEALRALGAAIAGRGLWSVYSTPDTLYRDDGQLDATTLAAAYAQAEALGARWVKLQLGRFAGQAAGERIATIGAGRRARLLVENGQGEHDGTIAQFVALFSALEREGAAGTLGMTFDVGNWDWAGQAPLDAARALAPYVEYIHCKSSEGQGARRFPVAPKADDSAVRAVFSMLPRTAPRAIEFPLAEQGLQDDATRRVAWLATV